MNNNLTRNQMEAILLQLSDDEDTSSRNIVDELVDEWFPEDIEVIPTRVVSSDITDDRFGMYVMEVYEKDYDTIED